MVSYWPKSKTFITLSRCIMGVLLFSFLPCSVSVTVIVVATVIEQSTKAPGMLGKNVSGGRE